MELIAYGRLFFECGTVFKLSNGLLALVRHTRTHTYSLKQPI